MIQATAESGRNHENTKVRNDEREKAPEIATRGCARMSDRESLFRVFVLSCFRDWLGEGFRWDEKMDRFNERDQGSYSVLSYNVVWPILGLAQRAEL